MTALFVRVLLIAALCLGRARWSAANKDVDEHFADGADLSWCDLLPEGTSALCTKSRTTRSSRQRHRAAPPTRPPPAASTDKADEDEDAETTRRPVKPAASGRALIDPEFLFLGSEQLPAGSVLMSPGSFEGDILGYDPTVSPAQLKEQSKNFIRDEKKKWPKGTVNFKMSSYFRPLESKHVRQALEDFTGKTGVQFKERTVEPDFVYIGPGIGCQSYTGKQGGQQILSLQMPDCKNTGVIHHELMHVAGFYHEQSRIDRDKYVEINWANIAVENRGQFQKYSAAEVTAFGEEYDYRSVMHYGQYDFAINPSEYTIRPRPGKTPSQAPAAGLGQRVALSAVDVIKMKLAYPKFDSRCPKEKGWVKVGQHKCYYFSFLADNKVTSFVEGRHYCRLRSASLATEQPNSLRYIFSVLEENRDVLALDELIWLANCKTISRGANEPEDAECVADTGQYFICYKRLHPQEPSATWLSYTQLAVSGVPPESADKSGGA